MKIPSAYTILNGVGTWYFFARKSNDAKTKYVHSICYINSRKSKWKEDITNLIGNLMKTQKTAAAKDYTVAELLGEDFINNFKKFGSLDQFLQHTGLAANAIIACAPGAVG